MPSKPLGKNPPSLTRLAGPVAASESPKVSTAAPATIMAMTAPTLMMVNQNSSSPNAFALARLAAPTMSSAVTIHTQRETSGNQKLM